MPIIRVHYPLLAAICSSLFTTPLMMAGINAVLPELGSSFEASGVELGLVGACYSLGLAVLQLTAGSLGDIAGHRRIFLSGALIFAIASMLGAITRNLQFFLFLRILQGSGGALLSASGLAMLAVSAPASERPLYLGLSGSAVYAGIACGPPLAGLITATFGWRCLFFINTFTSLLIFAIMKWRVTSEWRPAANSPFDIAGALLYGAAMITLTLAAAVMPFSVPCAGISLAICLLFLCGFFVREQYATFPILNLSLLKNSRVLRFSAVAAFGNYASMFGLLFYFSFFLQTFLGLKVQEAGLVLGIQAFTQMLATPWAAKWCKRFSEKFIAATGSGLCGCGLLTAAFLTPNSALATLIVAQILLGCGISLFSLANTNRILASGGKKGAGQTAAITGAVRTAGQLVSMIFVTLSISWFLGTQTISDETLTNFMRSMKSSLFLFAALNLAGIVFSMVNDKKHPHLI